MTINQAARAAGILWILQLLAATLSYGVLLDPILWTDDFLTAISQNTSVVKLAMLSDLLCGVAIVGIAIILYPILQTFNQRIALWYAGLRLVEFVCIIGQGILLLSLLSVAQEFAQTTLLESSNLEMLAKSIREQRDVTQNMTIITFCLGASLLYYLFYRTKLVPRFISIWGLLAVALLFTEVMLLTFDHSVGMILMAPMGLNELFLGCWLLVKGFQHQETDLA